MAIKLRAALFGLALPLVACTQQPANPTKVAAEVKDIAHQLVAAYNARLPATAVAFDAPDYVGMFHGGPVTQGPAADLQAMRQQLADRAARFVLSNETVDVAASGDLAVYRAAYSYRYTGSGSGNIVTENGNWAAAFKRQPDGTMKLAWTMGADLPPQR